MCNMKKARSSSMRKPTKQKFNIGDVVASDEKGTNKFTIEEVTQTSKGFLYRGHDEGGPLHQAPEDLLVKVVPRKMFYLYAFKSGQLVKNLLDDKGINVFGSGEWLENIIKLDIPGVLLPIQYDPKEIEEEEEEEESDFE